MTEMPDREVKPQGLFDALDDPVALLDLLPDGQRSDQLKRIASLLITDATRQQIQRARAASGWTTPNDADGGTLAELLLRPVETQPYLVDGLQGRGHNVVLAAQYKVGKTNLLGVYARALLDGLPFIGQETHLAPDESVFWLNFEMDQPDLAEYLRPMGLRESERLVLCHLRGRGLPLFAPAAFDWLKQRLIVARAGVLATDSWRRLCASSGVNENYNAETEPLLQRLDQLKAETGVRALVVTANTGRAKHEEGEEHARGATALDDWADARWVYTKGARGQRFFYADGRGVSFGGTGVSVDFDPTTHLVTLGGEDRREVKSSYLEDLAVACVTTEPGMKTTELKARLKDQAGGARSDEMGRAIHAAEKNGRIHNQKTGKADCWHPGPKSEEAAA